jgi:hypothetical protein
MNVELQRKHSANTLAITDHFFPVPIRFLLQTPSSLAYVTHFPNIKTAQNPATFTAPL